MRANPAYKKVSNRLNALVDRQGWIPALDGGRLHVRSAHKALNTSLQSAGALVAKMWTCIIEDKLLDLGWKHGWDGDFVILGFFHDELQIAVRDSSLNPARYVTPTYSDWTPESAKAEDEKDLKKKNDKHKAKHLQDWYYNGSEKIRTIAAVTKAAITEVEKHFEFRCPLDCEFKVGLNWADCH